MPHYIYRGFDIDQMRDKTYRVSLGIAKMSDGHATELDAETWIDNFKRERAANAK